MPTRSEYKQQLRKLYALVGNNDIVGERWSKPQLERKYNAFITEYPQLVEEFGDIYFWNGEFKTAKQHAIENGISTRTMKKRLAEQKILHDMKTGEIIEANTENIELIQVVLNVGPRRAKKILRTGEGVPEGFEVADNLAELKGDVKMRISPKYNYTDEQGRVRSPRITAEFMVNAADFADEKKRSAIMDKIFIDKTSYMTRDLFNDSKYVSNYSWTIPNIFSGSNALSFLNTIIREEQSLKIFNRGLKCFEVLDFEKVYEARMKPIIEADYNRKVKLSEIRGDDAERKTNINKRVVDYTDPKTCIKRYLLLNYPKIITQSYLAQFGDITIKDLLEIICKKYKIDCRIFNINAECVMQNYEHKTKEKRLILCIYNNHIYEITNMKLFRKKKELIYESLENIKYSKNIYEDIERVIKGGKLPENVICYGEDLISFESESVIYTSNKDWKLSFDMLNDKGLKNYYTPDMNSEKAFSIVLKNYKNDKNCYSYAPSFEGMTHQPFYWLNPSCRTTWGNMQPEFQDGSYRYNPDLTYLTIDKNKCYSSMLKNLPFLISRDDTKHKTTIYEGEPIIEHYLYYIEIEKPNMLLPDHFIYSGYYLNLVDQYSTIKIINVFETERIENYYKQIIIDMYHLYGKEMKHAINKHIGKMARFVNGDEIDSSKFIKICNEDEASTYTENHQRKDVGCGQHMIFQEIKNRPVNMTNNICVEWFIKDMSRWTLHQKIQEAGIKADDIMQIAVDSICYKKKNNKEITNINDELDGWNIEANKKRLINVKPLCNRKTYDFMYDILSNTDKPEAIFNTNGCFIDGRAGAGKSHYITNVIIPALGEDYEILTPQHTNNIEYKKRGFNSNVVQKYEYRNQDIKANNIIVDEIGLFGSRSLKVLYKQFKQGKNIFMLGDWRQQEPVNGKNISYNQFLISTMSRGNVYMLNSNYRNMNTAEDYDRMRNEMKYREKKQMALDHNKETIKQAALDGVTIDTMICYFTGDRAKKNEETGEIEIIKSSKKKYNEKIMDELKIGKYDPGFKAICKTNTLKKLKKYKDMEIYNNQSFIVEEVKGDDGDGEPHIIILTDGLKKYEILNTHYKRHFEPNYAMSLFNAQGRSIERFLICEDTRDLNMLICDNRRFYTLMSRIKTKDVLGQYT